MSRKRREIQKWKNLLEKSQREFCAALAKGAREPWPVVLGRWPVGVRRPSRVEELERTNRIIRESREAMRIYFIRTKAMAEDIRRYG